MPQISVVVPVYNVEKYLRRCLDSLVEQTFKDIEIICVDDGSPDNCGKILDEYAKQDQRIKVIHQENSGLASARNSGLKLAAGKYINFVDSDDFVNHCFLEKLYEAAERHQADIAVGSIIRRREHSEKFRVNYTEEKCAYTLPEKIAICNVPKCCYVWSRLYRRELVIDEKFADGLFFEDVLWLPGILKKSGLLVTVPGAAYYYWANPISIVKQPSAKKIVDRINSKRFIIKFFEKHDLPLSKRDYTINKKIYSLGKIALLKIKEYKNRETFYLFDILPIFWRPCLHADENTFVVWEPCSRSHSEVVPGYVKYLLDLGYSVSVVVNPEHYASGLFSRFSAENVFFNTFSRREAKRCFKKTDMSKLKGVLVTTAGKLSDNIFFEQVKKHFHKSLNPNRLFLVEHDAKFSIDAGTWDPDIITLRKLNYKNADSVVVNPHYFGDVKLSAKNNEITNFIMIGRLGAGQSDNAVVVDAAMKLLDAGITDFKITVVGKGSLNDLPERLSKFVDIKGRLPFDQMYDELEKADFLLTSYDTKRHEFYRTTGASGNFQLVYGFAKPCIIIRDFACINGFTEDNSIIYDTADEYSLAMRRAITMPADEYDAMQRCLRDNAKKLYDDSRKNIASLIRRKTGDAVNG